jgi:hypothetical protein
VRLSDLDYAEAYYSTRIDTPRLAVQIVSSLILIGMLYLILRN